MPHGVDGTNRGERCMAVAANITTDCAKGEQISIILLENALSGASMN